MVLRRSVGEVEANDIDTGFDEAFDHFGRVSGRAERGDYFGSALHSSDISFNGHSPGWWVMKRRTICADVTFRCGIYKENHYFSHQSGIFLTERLF